MTHLKTIDVTLGTVFIRVIVFDGNICDAKFES